MILADKIINERKKNGWSQEDLAEMLSVSRQSVSKWESAQAVPDLQKILKLAEIFGVSTDYLLKDEIEPEEATSMVTTYNEMVESVPPLKKVSMEEANEYLGVVRQITPRIALAVSACILSPAPLIGLTGLAEKEGSTLTEAAASGIGVVILLLMVAAAVCVFIMSGMKSKKFDYLKTTCFETEYGVSGMVKSLKNDFMPMYTRAIASGVVLCIISAIPTVISGVVNTPEYISVLTVCILLALVAVAVNIFINAGNIMGSYNILLEEGDYTRSHKNHLKKIQPIMGIYWSICTAIYLAASFITGAWYFTWIIWPVAGVLSAVIAAISKIAMRSED